MGHEWNFKRDREFLGTAHLAAQLDEAEAYQLLREQVRAARSCGPKRPWSEGAACASREA